MYYCNHQALPVSQVQVAGYAYQINYLAYLVDKLQQDIANLDPESQGEAITTLQNNVGALQEAVDALETTVAGKSTVAANPTLSGQESGLTGITVNGTSYKTGNVTAEVITMTGSLQDVADSVTLGKALDDFDMVMVTFGYLSAGSEYLLAHAAFKPTSPSVYQNNVVLTGINASDVTVELSVSILGTTLACISNSSGIEWLPVKMVGYKLF